MSGRARWAIGAAVAGVIAALWIAAWWVRRDSPAASQSADVPRAGGARAEQERSPGCGHPFVPTAQGSLLRYRWTSARGDGEIAMEVERVTRSAADEWQSRWRMTDGERAWTLDRRCGADGAEEPWLGLNSAGALELGEQTWRVPAALAPGDVYEGSVRASVAGIDIPLTRSHRVVGRERVATEVGDFEAVRVRVEERTAHAAAPLVIEQWLARGPGLVRMEQAGGGVEILYELVGWEGATPR